MSRVGKLVLVVALAPVFFAAAACSRTGDVCEGAAGTCVALTVTSAQIHTPIDSLILTASDAVSGKQTTNATAGATPPFQIALHFGATATGHVHLDVAATGGSGHLGSGSTDVTLAPGTHIAATVDLEPDASSNDLSVNDGMDGPSGDMLPASCDPHGLNGPPCVWRWQTPLPVGEDLRSVHAFADNDIFVLTESGAILHFDGTTWGLLAARPIPGMGSFRGLKLVGGKTDLYILGFNSVMGTPSEVFHSKDKGASWIEETLPSGAANNDNLTDIAVIPGIDDSNVVVVGGFAHIVRRDSSGTWTDYQLTCVGMSGCSTNFRPVTASLLDQVTFYGSTGAYVGSNTTWTPVTGLTGNTNFVQALCNGHDFGNTNIRYWGVGSNGVIATATQAAPTAWSLQSDPVSAILYGCTASDQNKVWAYGTNGTVISSTTGGVGASAWVAQTTNTTETLLSGSHSPGTKLTVVGQAGTILQATDGATFTSARTGVTGGFIAMFGLGPQLVYAVGLAGSIARTTDGTTWQAITTTGTTLILDAVWASSPTDVYAVGASGTVVHSIDGTTFTRYTNPGSGGIPAAANLTGVAGISANNVFVSSTQGLFRSTDGGATYAPVTVPGFTGMNVFTVYALGGDLWIGGDNGQIYHTTDGTSWGSQTLTGVGASLPISAFTGRASGEVFAGSSGTPFLAHTLNKGATWTSGLVASLGSTGLGQLALTPMGDYLYAQSNQLLVSQDGGMNFVPVNTAPVPRSVGAFFIASAASIFGATDSGIVHFGN